MSREMKVESLELNRETLQDMTEGEADEVQGGQKPFSKPGTCWVTGGKPSICQNLCFPTSYRCV